MRINIAEHPYMFVFGVLATAIVGCSLKSDVSGDNHILGTNAISAVGSCHKTVSLWSSVIAASSEDATNAVYYAGSITGKAVLVHETSRGAKQELYEDAYIDRSIIMPHTQNRDEWILLKGSGEDKVRFWDWQQEIRDFVRSRPRNSALVRKESSFLKIESNSEIVWLINVYDVDASLCPNMSKGDKLCTVELFDCDIKERNDLCSRARLDGTTVVRHQEFKDARLLYAHWNSGKFVRVENFCSESLFCIDNEIVAPFEFAWDGVYDGLIRFDENLAVGEYRRNSRVEHLIDKMDVAIEKKQWCMVTNSVGIQNRILIPAKVDDDFSREVVVSLKRVCPKEFADAVASSGAGNKLRVLGLENYFDNAICLTQTVRNFEDEASRLIGKKVGLRASHEKLSLERYESGDNAIDYRFHCFLWFELLW